ncbi:GatB/YqeY domain-containing protein [Algihabitans albus]|uniref:GatB/YqeY domain-containing protein n=1 Tax=Algihabitans albus TaxID=2164067 RepID=UPI0035CED362
MLRSELNDALKQALKNKDQQTLGTVRLILAALKDRDIAARGVGNCDGISEDEVLDMLQKMVKQRRESIELYAKGDRQDLVDKEQAEIDVIQRFMPQQLDEGETRVAVEQTIAELEAGSIKDMGRVMAALKERYAGRMDFSKASALAKGQLA